ncbi:DUF1330 domain-containing protein [Ruegeria sp. WL0004]|uniref:DUF1330 domain-containing protein n=1 Tax=Ruegeria marisflavi TaxID=2984152 RepID=A0ABT2WUZ3_9RHOB|nr:DUF1330 domain-containing protein [Ruegeria sp. WL0004]MCU9839468.1 DUF1330 domain-containing protein [Ruegeria sp. WL0004]
MPAYFIAQIEIRDPTGYQEYLAGFMPIFERHNGRLLTVSSKPVECVEGTWPEGGVVLMEFPDMEKARAWKNDPDYQELAKIRQHTATTNMVLVEGL